MAAINEHERVILTTTMPEVRLEAGDVGTVVHVYRGGRAHKVEFTTLDGRTLAVATVEASDVRPVTRYEITHAGDSRVDSTMTRRKQRTIKSDLPLPVDATVNEAVERLRLIAKIDEGLRQSDAGHLADHEEVKKRFSLEDRRRPGTYELPRPNRQEC